MMTQDKGRRDKSKDLINRPFYGMSSMSGYKEISKLGKGTFGEVVKAHSLKDKKLVALKSIIVHDNKGGFPIIALREVNIMKKLKNKNVLQLLELVCKKNNDIKSVRKTPTFYIVMPYAPNDLAGLLTNPRITFSHAQIKCLLRQLLEGINYIHGEHYFHRDIKAANILIDHQGVLKIADFGLARNYEGSAPRRGQGPCGSSRRYTGLVVTRWYRAPELLLGDARYTTAVDLWGVGCVFAEMFETKPILQGKSDLDQGRIIFELVGSPNQQNWKGYDQLPHAKQFAFPMAKRSLEARFSPRLGPQGVALLDGLLKLDPRLRFNALDALDHPYFKTAPLPCRPIDLPRFEECHEMDSTKFKEEEKMIRNRPPRDQAWGAASLPPQPMPTSRKPAPPQSYRQAAGDTRYPQQISSSFQNVHSHRNRRYHERETQYRPPRRQQRPDEMPFKRDSYIPVDGVPNRSQPSLKKRRYGDDESQYVDDRFARPQHRDDDDAMKIDYSDESLSADIRRAAAKANSHAQGAPKPTRPA